MRVPLLISLLLLFRFLIITTLPSLLFLAQGAPVDIDTDLWNMLRFLPLSLSLSLIGYSDNGCKLDDIIEAMLNIKNRKKIILSYSAICDIECATASFIIILLSIFTSQSFFVISFVVTL